VLPLGLLVLTAAALPDGPALSPPTFTTGDEIVYVGEVHEASERIDLPYRRKAAIEIRLFTLSVGQQGSDLAVLTQVRPLDDPQIAEAVKTVTGVVPDRSEAPPAVRLELIRVDARGRVYRLTPPPGPPPIPLSARTPTAPPPPVPLDAPPDREIGMFVPLPEALPTTGETWMVNDPDPARPPAVWQAKPPGIWNGAQVIEAAGLQQTTDWDEPKFGQTAWRRADRIWLSPVDGLARVVHRQIERKAGNDRIGWVVVQYEMKPPTPHRGESYLRVRKEIEHAYAFAATADPLLPQAVQLGSKRFELMIAAIERYKKDHPATAYREAVDAVLRRCEAAARGR
jgi:hypothetical protein